MSQQNDTGVITLTATEAIEQNDLVKLVAGGAAVNDEGDRPVGVAQAPAAANEPVSVRLLTRGTCIVKAGEAFADGANLYTADNGRVQDTAATGAFLVAQAKQAASGAGSLVEAVPLVTLGAAVA